MTDRPAHGTVELTAAQARALRVAVRNDRWWLHGKGSKGTARNLESRGLAIVLTDWRLPRPERYIVPTAAGREAIGAIDA